MLTVVIQAGGESRRMGQDKGLLPFLGEPLIQRVIRRVTPLADELLVTTNKPQDYAFLGLPQVPDRIPGRGALGGLYTALSAANHPMVAVVACDMPFVSPRLIQAELDLLAASLWQTAAGLSMGQELPPYDAVIPRTPGGTEPFHAAYLRSPCLPLVEAAIQADRWRVDSWYAQANLLFLDPEQTRQYDPRGLAFHNVNTPEELREAERLALELDDVHS